MADKLARGAAWLNTRMGDHVSRPITYTRAELSVTLNATVGQPDWETEEERDFRQRMETRDYIVSASDLKLGGLHVAPKRGDKITETIDGTDYKFEVRPLGPERQTHRYSDRSQLRFRIHTNKIGTA